MKSFRSFKLALEWLGLPRQPTVGMSKATGPVALSALPGQSHSQDARANLGAVAQAMGHNLLEQRANRPAPEIYCSGKLVIFP